MSDYYLTKFWNDVKDPSWPDISTWDDWLRVPEAMRRECIEVHDLYKRLADLEDPDHWRPWVIVPYQKDRFVFMNVLKCGSSHYRDFFENRLGWKRLEIASLKELRPYIKFGLMMHPLERYLKGLTQFAWDMGIRDDIKVEQMTISCVMPDSHSLSYHFQFGDLMHDINWIPFKGMTDHETKSCMNRLFHCFGSDMEIPLEHPPQNVTVGTKLKLYQTICRHWRDRLPPTKENGRSIDDPVPIQFNLNLYMVYMAFAQDLKFYRDLLGTFKPDWSHLRDKGTLLG